MRQSNGTKRNIDIQYSRNNILRLIKNTIKLLVISTLMTVVLIGAYLVYAHRNPLDVLRPEDGHTPEAWTPPPNFTPPPDVNFNTRIRATLFIGVDTGMGRTENWGYQSDVLMLLVTDTNTGKMTMISIPRDTLAVIDVLNSKGKVTGTKQTKINAAYSYGRGMNKYSCQNAVNAVSRLFGNIKIHDYICIDMDSVGPITEAVGGVPMVIDADFSHYGMPKGSTQNLMGKNALNYVRQRKLPGTDGSDISRTKRQLRFVKAFLAKVKSSGSISTLNRLYGPMKKYFRTNMGFDILTGYAALMEKIDFDNVETLSLKGKGDGEGNWKVDKDELYKLRLRLFYN